MPARTSRSTSAFATSSISTCTTPTTGCRRSTCRCRAASSSSPATRTTRSIRARRICCPLIPIPYVTSNAGRMGPRPARSERRAAGAAARFRAGPERLARGHPRRLRHLPQPVGLQRPDGVRAQPALLLHQAGGHPDPTSAVPTLRTARHPDERRHRHRRRVSIMDFDVQRRIQPDVERRPSVRAAPRRRCSKCRTWAPGRSAPTTPRSATCPSPDPDRFRPRRPIPQLSRINAIRFDGKSIYHGAHPQGRAPAARTTTPTTSATRCRLRKTTRRARDRPNRRPTSRRTCDNIFDETGEWALLELRPPPPVHRQRRAITSRSSSGAGSVKRGRSRRLARQRHFHRADRRAVHRQPRRRPREHRRRSGPASRPAARSQSRRRRPDAVERWFDTSAFPLPAQFTFGSAPRNSVRRAGLRQRRFRAGEDLGAPAHAATRVPVGGLQPVQPRELRSAEPHFRNPNFGRIFSAKNPREMQFGLRLAF